MDPAETTSEMTRLLRAWHAGSDTARDQLWAILYRELKGLAKAALRRRGAGRRPHGTTSLVHQAYLRLLGSDVEWQDRQHFFAVASRAMRYVLIDEARRQLADKRRLEPAAAPTGFTDLPEVADPRQARPEEVLAVHQALEQLAAVHPRHERLVELRYFAGLSVDETAEVLGVTPRTVVRDWKTVRAWLHHRLEATA